VHPFTSLINEKGISRPTEQWFANDQLLGADANTYLLGVKIK
jgi:hypothetical protein